MFPNIHNYSHLAIDTESTGLHWWKDKMFGFSISLPDGQDFYYDIRETPNARDWLAGEIKSYKGKIIAHNMKYDCHVTRETRIILPEDNLHDTVIRAALINEHLMAYDLDSLGLKYLGIGKDTSIYQKLADLFGGRATKNAQMPNLHRAPSSLVAPYAMQDTRTTLDLYEHQQIDMKKQDLGQVYKLECELTPALTDMEHRGVRIDVEQSERASHEIGQIVHREQDKLNKMAGFGVNVNPSNSLKTLIVKGKDRKGNWFAKCGTPLKKTKGGAPQIDADALRSLKMPEAEMVLKIRKLRKTKETFIDGHILGHHHNGVIHCNINQTKSDNDLGTGTGRLSINGPALQQIHKRDKEVASIVRALFLPDEGQIWECRDWSQMDFRVFAHYAQDPKILAMYDADPNTDFHEAVAGITGLPRSPRFSGDPNAKQINLGLVFGMGMGKLAQEMGLPFEIEMVDFRDGSGEKPILKPGEEAIAVFDTYHSAIPGVNRVLKKARSIAKSRGYVKTIMNRRIRFPGKKYVHKAGGLVFQGSAADALKQKIVEVHRFLKGTDGRILINVHDELDTSLPSDDVKLGEGIREIMETFDGVSTPIKFRVPIRSDSGRGPNWWEACK